MEIEAFNNMTDKGELIFQRKLKGLLCCLVE